MKLRSRRCAMVEGAAQPNSKIAVGVTVADWIEKISLEGEGRHKLRRKYLKIFCQRCIYDIVMEGMVGFESKN